MQGASWNINTPPFGSNLHLINVFQAGWDESLITFATIAYTLRPSAVTAFEIS
jgi:hypothetical protein